MDNTPENILGSFESTSSALVPNNNLYNTLSGNLDYILEGFDYLESFPTGYRFFPTDEELICDYLLPQIAKQTLPPNRFHIVNIYSYPPEQLSELYQRQGDNWYFFTTRDRKYKKGMRPNRVVSDMNREPIGYWKATGSNNQVISKKEGKSVGEKQALVYYKGKSSSGEKQPWVMHEYFVRERSIEARENVLKLDDCVLCKIYMQSEINHSGSNDKGNGGKAQAAQDQDQDQDSDQDQDQDQNQNHQLDNQEQGLDQSDSPGSPKSTVMDTDNGNNNFTAYDFATHECVNSYHPLPTETHYYPNRFSLNTLLPIPCVIQGNDKTSSSMGSFERMLLVEEQQQFQGTEQSSLCYDHGIIRCHNCQI